jgi:16S rRNA (cytosine1402-N4)-methyltransferase
MDQLSSETEESQFHHISVLSQELITGLNIIPDGYYLDATVGGGGHSELILSAFPNIHLTALDQDQNALNAARQKLNKYGETRINFIQTNFAQYRPKDLKFNGIIADLGVSSHQLDTPERGFSFQQEAPLDMRMDQQQKLTAKEIINYWSEKDLADIFYNYGEERFSRRFAKLIMEKRPINTTTELANLIRNAVPSKARYGRIHPATRIFQGLRIAVNQELKSLENFLDHSPNLLAQNAIIGIISFHSLEDRIVKHFFRNCEQLKVLTKKPIIATEEEQKNNPRSRSAKLRFAQKI